MPAAFCCAFGLAEVKITSIPTVPLGLTVKALLRTSAVSLSLNPRAKTHLAIRQAPALCLGLGSLHLGPLDHWLASIPTNSFTV